MKILSPDALMIELVDRALAIPQRNGIILPRLLSWFLAGSIGALGAEAACALAVGQPLFAGLGVCLAAGAAWGLRAQRSLYRLHVSTWGPSRMTEYRSLALWHRESMTLVRVFQLLGGTLFFAHILARLDWSRWPMILVLTVPMFLAFAFMLLQQYGACSIPRDPDLRRKVGGFAELGAG